MKSKIYISLILLVILQSCSFFDPLNTKFEDVEDAKLFEAKVKTDAPVAPDNLKIMTWNIKHSGGKYIFYWELDGTKYNMSEKEVNYTMDGIVDLINKVDPDILIMQEIDRESKWSAYINQVKYILNKTKLNYGAYASIIHGDFVPSDGMQRLDMGNATFSKWPISKATRYSLPELPDLDALTAYFYFQRNLLVVKTEVPGNDNFYILNIHTEPFDEGAKDDDHTKKRHIDFFKDEMDDLTNRGYTVIGGGDFNAMPNNSDAWEGFPDVGGDLASKASYVGEEDWMDALMTDYNSAIPFDDLTGTDSPGIYTFPSMYSGFPDGNLGAWNRVLDYLFSTPVNTFSDTSILQTETYDDLLSDHAPIVTTMEL